jgi:hypothetical protein
MRKKRNACEILAVKPEGNTPLARYNYRWEYNIKIGF